MSTKEKMEIINNDIELWLLNFVKILDAENKTIPFQVNKAQKDFLKNMDKYNIILKSRQLGFSTLSLGIMLYYAYQIPNSTYLMVAHNKPSLRELFNRLKMMQNSIPEKYRLAEDKNNRDELGLSNGSRIIVQCPSDGLGAGMTLQMVHLSEFALYSDIEQTTGLATVEQSLAKNENSMIIIESTARGVSNNFFNIWQESSKGRSRYKPFFYGWCDKSHLDLFRYEVDLATEWYKSINKGNPLSSDPLELTPYERMLLKDTKVTLKQLMWRQWKLQGMEEKTFRQEYPAFPTEAFVTSSTTVFDADTVLNRSYYTPEPLKHIPDLPLSLQKYIGKGLNIYKTPEKNMRYYAGIDVASGLGGKTDNSAICILDSNGEQVLQFARNDIPVYKLVDIVTQLGYFYNYMMVLVERNTFGLDLINRLVKEKQYINVLKTKKFDKITGRRKWEHGWYTDANSKAKLVSDGKQMFEEGMVLINDKETLQEMQIYQEDRGKFGNAKGDGNRDDRIDSVMLAIQNLQMGRYYV